MMAELIFKRDFPDALRPEFQGYFDKFNCVVPKWVNSVTIHYEPQPPDYEAIMEVMARTEYRSVDIVVYSDFLLLDNTERKERAFLHEFSHVFFAQLHRQALCIAEMLPDDISQNLAYEGIRMANEAATEDVSTCLYDMLKNIKVVDTKVSIHNYTDFENAITDYIAMPNGGKAILNALNNKNKVRAIAKGTQTSQKVAAKPRKKK